MIRVDMTWYCPTCRRPGKLVPASLGDPAFWICVNTNCGNQNTAPAADRDSRDTDLFAITNAELSRAVTLFHELDVKRKRGMTTANMLRVLFADLLKSRAASVPEDHE